MSIFHDDDIYAQPKTKIMSRMLTKATPQELRFMLLFEDQIVGKFEDNFPEKILYSISDIETIEESMRTGTPCRWSDYYNGMTFKSEEDEMSDMVSAT